MDNSKISARYAKALFEAAIDTNVLDEIYSDICQIKKLCTESHEFMLFLNNTLIRRPKKEEILHEIFAGKIEPLTWNFILLLIGKTRESYLPGICRNFTDRYRKHKNIIPVTVTSAKKLSSETALKITHHLTLHTGGTVELFEKVNPAIIGGLILQIGDYQYDGSITQQLKRVKKDLLGKRMV